MMNKVSLNELPQSVQTFLESVWADEGVIVEKPGGQPWIGVVPYLQASPEEQAAAWRRIQEFQAKVGNMMAETGATEEEFDRLVQEDD
jgi:hypothetical protein